MYGTPNGFTAMAQAVGKPAAIVAKMILCGKCVPPTGLVTRPSFAMAAANTTASLLAE